MQESSLRVIVFPSLVYPYSELDMEQGEKQETDWIECFCSSLLMPSILE